MRTEARSIGRVEEVEWQVVGGGGYLCEVFMFGVCVRLCRDDFFYGEREKT